MAISRELKLYNSLTRSVEPLPCDRAFFGFYFCGPTVYGRAHIGNFRSLICADLVARTLEAFGYPLKYVRNLTDVDDKTIRGAKEANAPLKEFTQKHIDEFHGDCKSLNLRTPEVEARATDHVSMMIRVIKRLMTRGFAYQADDGSVYFRIASFPEYGRLAHLDAAGLKSGARVDQDEYDKESPADFALWKAHRPEDGQAVWESPWGPGRPGWHIECSAMSMEYLGETYELHGGGVDLLFPHHENEIAQSECATGLPFVGHWFHVAHLQVEGRKMSKSLGNLHTLDDIRAMGFGDNEFGHLDELRLALLWSHYREPLNFTRASLSDARAALQRLNNFSIRLHEVAWGGAAEASERSYELKASDFQEQFLDSLQEDLNISAALARLFDAVTQVNTAIDHRNLSVAEAMEWIAALNFVGTRILGFQFQVPHQPPPDVAAI
ncbi:MAG: cysteine--tRNA ligase, partial [Verrucomicrobiae bacterium]|nr:cysteine--tRNA ligase [Verrucomicrobiae bacterium]